MQLAHYCPPAPHNTNQSINQIKSINQPTNQPVNQSINQSIMYFYSGLNSRATSGFSNIASQVKRRALIPFSVQPFNPLCFHSFHKLLELAFSCWLISFLLNQSINHNYFSQLCFISVLFHMCERPKTARQQVHNDVVWRPFAICY